MHQAFGMNAYERMWTRWNKTNEQTSKQTILAAEIVIAAWAAPAAIVVAAARNKFTKQFYSRFVSPWPWLATIASGNTWWNINHCYGCWCFCCYCSISSMEMHAKMPFCYAILSLLSLPAHFVSDFILHSLRALACGKWKSLTSPHLMHTRVLRVWQNCKRNEGSFFYYKR